MSATAPPQQSPSAPSKDTNDGRRAFILAGLALTLVVVIGVVAVTLTSDPGPRRDTQGQLTEDGGAKPHIIPRPGEGKAPENPGDRGGWEQLALFALMLAAMVGIGFVIFHGSRKTRAARARWLAAASPPPPTGQAATRGAPPSGGSAHS